MKKGFTLVEILVVLVIIGILVALILPNALRAIDQGNIKATASTLRNIDTAIKLCYSDKQTWASCGAGGVTDLDGTGANAPAVYMDPLPTGNDPWGTPYSIIPNPEGVQFGYQSNKATHFAAWPDLTTVIRGGK